MSTADLPTRNHLLRHLAAALRYLIDHAATNGADVAEASAALAAAERVIDEQETASCSRPASR